MGKEGGTVKIRRLKTSKIALHILTSSNNKGEMWGRRRLEDWEHQKLPCTSSLAVTMGGGGSGKENRLEKQKPRG